MSLQDELRTEAKESDTKEAIKTVLTSIVAASNNELLLMSEDELKYAWYFRWEPQHSVGYNVYQFSGMLEMLKERTRRWEEHHNGSCCVVERVRDKYLMPRVLDFLDELSTQQATSPPLPADSVVMPKEPTPKMIEVGAEAAAHAHHVDISWSESAESIYKAMIAATEKNN